MYCAFIAVGEGHLAALQVFAAVVVTNIPIYFPLPHELHLAAESAPHFPPGTNFESLTANYVMINKIFIIVPFDGADGYVNLLAPPRIYATPLVVLRALQPFMIINIDEFG